MKGTIMAEHAVENTDEEYTPVVSPTVRTVIYVLGVIVGFVTFILVGGASALGLPESVVTISGLVGTGYATVATAFGVAYRPTK
jgi:hypothetical protein